MAHNDEALQCNSDSGRLLSTSHSPGTGLGAPLVLTCLLQMSVPVMAVLQLRTLKYLQVMGLVLNHRHIKWLSWDLSTGSLHSGHLREH